MKLSGNSRNGRYVGNSRGTQRTESKAPVKKKKRGRIVMVSVLLSVTVLLAGVVLYILYGGSPPEVTPTPKPPNLPTETDAPQVTEPGDTTLPAREADHYYTFLLLGTDDGNGNTDVMMVARLDVRDYSLDVVSIPRDTLVNVSWSTKKANSLFANGYVKGGGVDGGFERAISGLEDMLGFKVDFGLMVDMDAFIKLVDGIGGVDYYVTQPLKYSDPYQNLSINYAKGQYHLTGKQALEIVRCRSIPGADIGRIGTQQDLLKTIAGQVLQNKKSLKLATIIDIVLNDVKMSSNLTIDNVKWFAQQCLKLDLENINFHTLPGNYNDSVNGNSYVTIKLDEWLKMINEALNPFTEDIALDNVSIYTRDPNTKKLYVTDGNYAGKSTWGSGGSGGTSTSSSPAVSNSPSPSPSPSPTPSETVTPSPGNTESPPPVTDSPAPTDSGSDESPPPVTDSPAPTDSAQPSPTPSETSDIPPGETEESPGVVG